MSEVSRRDFFLRFGHSVTDHIDLEKLSALIPGDLKITHSQKKKEDWVFVGTLSEMSPGAKKKVRLGEQELLLKASEKGIWLSDSTSQKGIAIRLESGGRIFANPSIDWPRSRVLSQSSGEPKDLEIEHGK